MSESGIERSIDPEDAFGILASPTRVDVLRALWNAEEHEATFSELRDAVGVDDSGKFNYHLGQFDGQFVERTDSGYRLTRAGVRVVGALVAGTYTKTGEVGPVRSETDCPGCGGATSFRYVEDRALVECDVCGVVSRFPVPPGVLVGHDRETLPAVASRYARTELYRGIRGFCGDCEGRLDARLVTAAETAGEGTDPPVDLADVPMVVDRCRRCGTETATNLGMRLFEHPAVVAFYHDHGLDYREIPLWRFAATGDRTTVHERTPTRASVTYEAGGERLRLTVDDSLSVVDVERTDG